MKNWVGARASVACALAIGALYGAGVASAKRNVTIPSTNDDSATCGARTPAWECWDDRTPLRPGEQAFLDQRLQYNMVGIPTNPTRLVLIARGICQYLYNGTDPNFVVQWLAEYLGADQGVTGQMFITAQSTAC